MSMKSNGYRKRLPPVWEKEVEKVIESVVREFGFDDETDIWERTRVPYRCWARWIVWSRMCEIGLSANQTGKITGWNHGSVTNGITRLREDVVNNADIRGIFQRVSAVIDE
jgi:hypothetical protein